jgi:hypothetical protein
MKHETTILQRRFLVWVLLKYELRQDLTRRRVQLSDPEIVKVAKRMIGYHSGSGFRAYPSSWPQWVRTVAKHVPDDALSDDGKRWTRRVVQEDVEWLREHGVPSIKEVVPSRHYVKAAQEWAKCRLDESDVMRSTGKRYTPADQCVDSLRFVLDTLIGVLRHPFDGDQAA